MTGFAELKDQINKTTDLQEKELLQQQFDAVLVQEQVTFADQSTAINQFWFERRSGRLLQSQQQAAAFAPVALLS